LSSHVFFSASYVELTKPFQFLSSIARKSPSVVVARVPGLFPEQNVTGMCLDGENSVIVLPASHELVEVAGCHLVGVFLKHFEKLQPFSKHGLGCHVPGADSAKILIGDLLESCLEHLRPYVIRVDQRIGRVNFIFLEYFIRQVELARDLVIRLGDGRFEIRLVEDQCDGGLCCDSAFSMGAGGETCVQMRRQRHRP